MEILLGKFSTQLTSLLANTLDFLTFLINYEHFDFFSHFATRKRKIKGKGTLVNLRLLTTHRIKVD